MADHDKEKVRMMELNTRQAAVRFLHKIVSAEKGHHSLEAKKIRHELKQNRRNINLTPDLPGLRALNTTLGQNPNLNPSRHGTPKPKR